MREPRTELKGLDKLIVITLDGFFYGPFFYADDAASTAKLLGERLAGVVSLKDAANAGK